MNQNTDQLSHNQTSELNAQLEVEQKYRVLSHEALLSRLSELDAHELPPERHCDTYLQHPCRDFAVTGEALRMRSVNDSTVVTYKGTRHAGPIKTRKEIEVPLVKETELDWNQIWLLLGFREIAQVVKTRRSFQIQYSLASITIALDDVNDLGKFVEIESIVNDIAQLPNVQKSIQEVAALLRLDDIEPRSYLRQLLKLRETTTP
ncbi:MAG: class IV adenylate cyclase [Pirellulaceae bacterium]|nr:class IV adenylate cyclase [Pirellulaceae bacterium]